MRTCKFSEILLLSLKERKARRVQFDQSLTVVLGSNDTGKSSLLKSIYQTFGTEPAKTHPKWQEARTINVVRFSVESTSYSIVRSHNSYAVFGQDGALLRTFSKVTGDLAPYLADLFDFGVKLADKVGNAITPPPAFLFLPFYIDQDSSWKNNWSSFAKLTQLSRWKQPLAEYHTGLKTNEYYSLKAKLDQAKIKVADLNMQLEHLKLARERLEKEIPDDTFDLSLDSFKEHIEELIAASRRLRAQEERYKSERTEYANTRIAIQEQIKITESALREIIADFHFATEKIKEETVECPTCGATYSNSFAERFSIAQDEDRCRELLLELQAELQEVEKKIVDLDQRLLGNKTEVSKINVILAEKQGTLQLRDIIESEGRKEVRRVFRESLNSYYKSIGETEEEIRKTNKEIRDIEDRRRRDEILGFYRSKMRQYLYDLDVHTMSEDSYEKVESEIRETGSDLPRALLAYYYSILQTMARYSTSAFCPIVIDSPNQQGQDPLSLKRMLEFILKNRPEGSQLILGLENLLDLTPDGKLITLEEKYNLLREEEFEPVRSEVIPLLNEFPLFSNQDRTLG